MCKYDINNLLFLLCIRIPHFFTKENGLTFFKYGLTRGVISHNHSNRFVLNFAKMWLRDKCTPSENGRC